MKETILLLKIIKEDILEADIYDFTGICHAVTVLVFRDIITRDEGNFIIDYIEERAPDNSGGYWWYRGEKAPRIEFLNILIDELR